MRSRIRDVLVSVLALVALFAALARMDPRVNERLGGISSSLQGTRWQDTPLVAAGFLMEILGTDAGRDALLLSFLLAGVVLLLLLMRT